ncbi:MULTISPECIES: hypothetical protein [unclassified Cyanobium]|uniref:hypothetical protein n=1 Tax=unclassified Cyanobium TaxID=2627006 RepID=UPI0020CC22C0|nr:MULTISPECIES: hypothetical protein [unclassified Cyanobium]MCP9859925.1 hypothetical protein [Cyanobium sp. Cruz-8H5]MCP9866977.1 hypothetical protein [Cyanobium sp. Cruz-8D1]
MPVQRLWVSMIQPMVVAEAVKLETATPTFRFRPLGPGRFFVAAFLAFWLCGWLAGEVFAVSLLWKLLSTFLTTGQGTLPATLFLLVWVSFWSVGGAAALHHLVGGPAERRGGRESGAMGAAGTLSPPACPAPRGYPAFPGA